MNRSFYHPTRAARWMCIALVAILSSACAGRQPAPAPIKNPNDPLIGRIYTAVAGDPLSEAELYDRMAASDVIDKAFGNCAGYLHPNGSSVMTGNC